MKLKLARITCINLGLVTLTLFGCAKSEPKDNIMCMTPAILAFIFADDVEVPRGTVVRTTLNQTVNLRAEYGSATGCVATSDNYWLLDEAAETRVYNTCLSIDYSAPGRHRIQFMKLEPASLCSPTAGMASIEVLIDAQ